MYGGGGWKSEGRRRWGGGGRGVRRNKRKWGIYGGWSKKMRINTGRRWGEGGGVDKILCIFSL